MTDKQFQHLMDQTIKASYKHRRLLVALEEEYKRRFGAYPADVDDDWFIDSFSYEGGGTTVAEVTENAMLHQKPIEP